MQAPRPSPDACASYIYNLSLIAALSGAYLTAYLTMWLFVAASGGSLKGVAGNISVIIFIGVIAVVTFLDWQGLITVRGLVNWSAYQGGKRRALIGLFVIGLVPVLGA